MKPIIFACAALLLSIATSSQAQPGGGPGGMGRRGGGMGMGMESEWALICFELKVDGKQFSELRTVYLEAWGQRKALMEQMRSGSMEREEMGQKMEKIQTDLTEKTHKILSKEQVAKLESLLEERRNAWGGGRGQGR